MTAKPAKRRETRAQALARLRGQADEYADKLRLEITKFSENGASLWVALDQLITEFARLRVAVAAHLNGEK